MPIGKRLPYTTMGASIAICFVHLYEMRRPVSRGMRYAPNVRRARGTEKETGNELPHDSHPRFFNDPGILNPARSDVADRDASTPLAVRDGLPTFGEFAEVSRIIEE